MSLQARIQEALKEAMKARDTQRLATLRLLKSALSYAEIEAGKDELDDAQVMAIVQRECKKRRDAIEQYQQGARPELALQEERELEILQEFLPPPLSQEELEALVQQTIEELGASGRSDMGRVIKAVQAKATGRADGKTISAVVGRTLA